MTAPFWKDGKRTPENGCCSAIEPCSTQRRDPNALCDVCTKAAALSATPAQEPEGEDKPVAWMYPKRWGYGLSFAKPDQCWDEDNEPVEPTPLYAHPAPSAADGKVERALRARINDVEAGYDEALSEHDKTIAELSREKARATAAEARVAELTEALAAEREACAQIASAFEDENYRMAMDTVHLSPVLRDKDFSPAAMEKEARLTSEAHWHSAMSKAGQDIAAAIRARSAPASSEDVG